MNAHVNMSAMPKPNRPAPPRPWTAADDELIRKIYSTRTLADRRVAIAEGLVKLRRDRHSCYRRAEALGCLYQLGRYEHPWTPEEDALLDRLAHLKSPALATRFRRAGYNRSPVAIIQRRRERQIDYQNAREDAGLYSASQAAVALGTTDYQVLGFIRRGWLQATKEGEGRTHTWTIRAADLRKFILNYTAHVRFDQADKYQLVDILCPNHGAKSGAES